MLTNMAKRQLFFIFWAPLLINFLFSDGDPDSIDRNKFSTSSPGPANSMASNAEDTNGVIGESSDNLPSTVFLDPNGNFSIHPPLATDHAQNETAPKKVLRKQQ